MQQRPSHATLKMNLPSSLPSPKNLAIVPKETIVLESKFSFKNENEYKRSKKLAGTKGSPNPPEEPPSQKINA